MVVTESPELGVVAVDREADIATLTSSDELATTEDDLAVLAVRGPSSERQVAKSGTCSSFRHTGHVPTLSSVIPPGAACSSGMALACGSG